MITVELLRHRDSMYPFNKAIVLQTPGEVHYAVLEWLEDMGLDATEEQAPAALFNNMGRILVRGPQRD